MRLLVILNCLLNPLRHVPMPSSFAKVILNYWNSGSFGPVLALLMEINRCSTKLRYYLLILWPTEPILAVPRCNDLQSRELRANPNLMHPKETVQAECETTVRGVYMTMKQTLDEWERSQVDRADT